MLEFRLLGPLEAVADGAAVALAGQKQRALLGLLLIRAGELIPSERIVTELWGETPPPTAATSLQNLVSQLRRLLGPAAIVTRAPGYALAVAPEQIDAVRFERLVAAAHALPAAERSEQLAGALALWRGPPLADLAFEAFAQTEIRRLEELRLSAVEARLGAEIELGRGAALVPELEALHSAHPLREATCGRLLLALCAAGRQSDAIRVYHETRARLADELGIDPSPALEQTYRQILRREDAVFAADGSGAGAAAGARGAAGPDHVGDVVRALVAGRLVPVLGWDGGSAADADRALLALGREAVAAQLCRSFGLAPVGGTGLARICQEIALTAGVGPLYDELHAIFDRDVSPGPAHRLAVEAATLARDRGLPRPVVVTAGFDTALERAFDEAGEQVDVVSYIAYGRNLGKFLHVAPDGAATVVDVANDYVGLSLDERPVVLKIHGRVDRREPDLDSFVVSEDDHIDYLAQGDISSVIPAVLVARLRRSHFLFLGYPLRDWGLRVFFHRVWGREKVSYRSWAVGGAAEPVDRELWRQTGVDLLDLPLEAFAERLRIRLEGTT